MFSSFIFSKKHFWSLKSHVYINEHNGFVDCFANDENNDDDDKDNVVVFSPFYYARYGAFFKILIGTV